jgi:putative exosortase-associated protein (TIGR04073 family)
MPTMKRFYKTLIALFVLLVFSLPAMAAVAAEAEIKADGTCLRKLQRGFLNVALCPFDISNELSKEVRNDTIPPSWFAGLGRGACYMVGRALVGVYEMVTFPIPYPAKYKPVLSPEFPWQLAPSPEKKL